MSLIMSHRLPRRPMFKLLRPDWVHNNFAYRRGWNTDTYSLVAEGECRAGGLYFGTLYGCAGILNNDSNVNHFWLARVMLAENEPVWRESDDKMKARTICLMEPTQIRKMSNLLYQQVFIGLALGNPCSMAYFDWRKIERKKDFADELMWIDPRFVDYIPDEFMK